MNSKLEKAVMDEYKATYSDWSNIKVSKVVDLPYAGKLVVVHAINEESKEIEPEICHYSNDGHVTIFTSSESLAVHLQQQVRQRWLDKAFSKTSVSAFVMIFLLFALTVFAFSDKYSGASSEKDVGDLFGKGFIAAIAFYFGSTTKQKSDLED
jgi:hypothetical protein